jgi:RimJ/RimL family protein N-acetyltransferase
MPSTGPARTPSSSAGRHSPTPIPRRTPTGSWTRHGPQWEEGRGAELAITVDGKLVGSIHIVFYADWRASVAYWLAAEARGQGYATRSVRLLAHWAFETFPALVRIELWSILGNEASDAVARRSGFVEEGVLRSRLPYRGGYRDVRCFSLVRGDYGS